jgi:integrase
MTKHLTYQSSTAAKAPALAGLSESSRWYDPVWLLDHRVAGRSACDAVLRWDVVLPDSSRLTDPQHEGWLETGRWLLWCSRMDPPFGRHPCDIGTLRSKLSAFRVLIRWMHGEGLQQFRHIDRATVERYVLFLRSRPGRRRATIAPGSVLTHLILLHDLWLLRDKLPDALIFDPFPEETPATVAGDCAAVRRPLAFIPDDVAIDILSKALLWVEQESASIIDARIQWYDAYQSASARYTGQVWPYFHANRALRGGPCTTPAGVPLHTSKALRQAVKHLSTACFIVIAGFVGMRVSEILSLRVGAVVRDADQSGSPGQTWLQGRLYKTQDRSLARDERWIAPAAAVMAVEVLERLTAPHRHGHDCSELFLTHSSKGRVPKAVTGACMTQHINDFAAVAGVPHHQGQPWYFSPHQFRKTFARFVAKRDRTQLLGLADHFKHSSTSVTARSYVGTNFELSELVSHDARVDTAVALDRMLSGAPMAGRIGQRVALAGAAFRGRAGEQVRRDYIRFILDETDLQIHACEYGWCVFQPETARCGGVAGPAPSGRSPPICLSCSNFAVDQRHRPWWEERRERNQVLLAASDRLAGAVLEEIVAQCDRVLDQLKEHEQDANTGGTGAPAGA